MSIKTLVSLALAFVLSVGLGLFFGNGFVAKMKQNAIPPEDAGDITVDDLSDVTQPDNGKTPADYDALYNFRYAKKLLVSAPSAEVVITGDVYSIMGEHQIVNTVRKFDGKDCFFQSTSEGKFAKVYSRSFYTLNAENVFITSDYNGGNWGAYTEIALKGDKGYLEQNGSMPQEFIPYIVTSDSVTDIGEVTATDGVYTMKLTLDPEKGAINYRRYVKNSAGSVILPQYKALSLTLTVDENWCIKTIYIEEKYGVKKDMGIMGTIAADCDSTAMQVFTIGKPVAINDNERP